MSNLILKQSNKRFVVPVLPSMQSSNRAFSALADILSKELIYEKNEESSGEIDQDFVDIKKQILKTFKIKDVVGEG